jgi:hypothetical protein
VRVLKAAFSDVVLHTLTGCIPYADVEPLGALLTGLGPLVVFEYFHGRQIELRDEDGHIRRLQSLSIEEYEDDDEATWGPRNKSFRDKEVWTYLSVHYDLHNTVREIRIHWKYWVDYIEVFKLYPPQLQDGLILVVETPVFLSLTGDEQKMQATQIMRLPGLAKVEFCGSSTSEYVLLPRVLEVLAHIEPPMGRTVEVCIANKKLKRAEQEVPFQAVALPGNSWTICRHCVH